MRVEAGGVVGIHQDKRSKVFRVGESVVFTAQEFSGLCWTIFIYGHQMANLLKEYAQDIGLPMIEPD